jgi:RNA polymerase sigma factor (sigma-70 family)
MRVTERSDPMIDDRIIGKCSDDPSEEGVAMKTLDCLLFDLVQVTVSTAKRLSMPDSIRDDVISDACLTVSQKLGQLAELDHEAATRWVSAVTCNAMRNCVRAHARRSKMCERLAFVSRVDWTETHGDVSPTLQSGLNNLSPFERELLFAQVCEGQSTAAIASQFGLTESAVRQRLVRARRKARGKDCANRVA